LKKEAWRRDPSFYDRLYPLATRYTDVDLWRHLNNVAVSCLHIEARTLWQLQTFGPDAWFSDGVLLRPSVTATDFINEGRYPGMVEIAARSVARQEDGWDIASALFQNGACFGVQHSHLVAWCDGVQVSMPAEWLEGDVQSQGLDVAPVRPAGPPASLLQEYATQVDITGRFGDDDVDGCFSEGGVARCMEQARAITTGRYIRAASPEIASGKLGTVVAHSVTRFISHRRTPPTMRAGIGVAHVGNTSMTVRVGLFKEEECLAVSDTILVLTDRSTGRPTPWPQSARESLLEKQLRTVTA